MTCWFMVVYIMQAIVSAWNCGAIVIVEGDVWDMKSVIVDLDLFFCNL